MASGCAQLTSFFLLNVALAVVDEARLSLVSTLQERWLVDFVDFVS